MEISPQYSPKTPLYKKKWAIPIYIVVVVFGSLAVFHLPHSVRSMYRAFSHYNDVVKKNTLYKDLYARSNNRVSELEREAVGAYDGVIYVRGVEKEPLEDRVFFPTDAVYSVLDRV
ncbi:MAG: hypothetical protein QM526_02440 [Alphaproteobacteria bacterium]|nr:hypothetical protein [Alphaproteobacteria bacterium]